MNRNSGGTAVVATSPFLTLDQAAAELRVPPRDVLRLIAKGHLDAQAAGDLWKVTPDQLRAYVEGGAPDLEALPWNREANWFQADEAEASAARLPGLSKPRWNVVFRRRFPLEGSRRTTAADIRPPLMLLRTRPF